MLFREQAAAFPVLGKSFPNLSLADNIQQLRSRSPLFPF
jgi:hypothetical protein